MKLSEKHEKYLTDGLDATFGVITKENIPHLTTVWVALHNEKIYFSTETTRIKYKHIENNKDNKACISIIRTGSGYVSFEGHLKIRNKEEFTDYHIVISKIVEKYVPLDKATEFIASILGNEMRILVELDPTAIYP